MVASGCRNRVPLSGSTSPATILSNVDLPEPLRPTRQTRSPGGDGEVDAFEQRRAAERQRDTAELEQRRRHQAAPICAAQPADGAVELGEEGGAVARRERRRAAAHHLAGLAQIGHQVAHGERHADRSVGERAAVGRDHLGAGLDAAARQRNVVGNDDGAGVGARGDPVVGRIEAGADRDALDHGIARHLDRAVGDHPDAQPMPLGDAIDFLLHRAGIGIDQDRDPGGRIIDRSSHQRSSA